MADDVRVTNWPDENSGSAERVALDLAKFIWNIEHPYGTAKPESPRKLVLDLYAECFKATRGRRAANTD